MGGHIQARAQAQNRSGILGDIGLEKRNLHDVGGVGSADEMSE
jgi:hypothetical protein